MEKMPQASAAFGIFEMDALDDLARWFDEGVAQGGAADIVGRASLDPGMNRTAAANSR